MAAKETKRTATSRKSTKAVAVSAGPTLVVEAPEPKPARTTAKKTTQIQPTHDQIRDRAFSIFLKRNGGPGDSHGDWLEAERQLIAELNK